MKLDLPVDRAAFAAFSHWYDGSARQAEASWRKLPPDFVQCWYDTVAVVSRELGVNSPATVHLDPGATP